MKKIINCILIMIFIYALFMVCSSTLNWWNNKRVNSNIKKTFYEGKRNEEKSKAAEKHENNSEVDYEEIIDTEGKLNEEKKIIEKGNEESEKINHSNTKSIDKSYNELLKINADIVGWINIPNTVIDYPVVKNHNNEYYLKHNIMHEEKPEGSIFMDFRNNIDNYSKNSILYGHNMKNGTMFTDLMKYKNEDFFRNNNMINFDSLYDKTQWEIFSAYVTDTEFYYIQVNFKDSEEYGEFLKTIKEKSLFKNNSEVNSDDDILTLSTCTYEFDNARFVVHAKRITDEAFEQ